MTLKETQEKVLLQFPPDFLGGLVELYGGKDGVYKLEPEQVKEVVTCPKCKAGKLMFASVEIETGLATGGNGTVKNVCAISTCSNGGCNLVAKIPLGNCLFTPHSFAKPVKIKPSGPKTKAKKRPWGKVK